MSKLKGFFIDLDLIDPFPLFGLEEYLVENTENIYLIFYSFPSSVILGRTSKVREEVYLENIYEDRLILARRRSGGGVVYIKPDQLCVSFIFPKGYLPKDLLEKYKVFTSIILRSIKDFTNFLDHDERGNIFLKDGKISGCGSYLSKNSYLHHLTIIREPLFNMEKYLKRIKYNTSYLMVSKEILKENILNQMKESFKIFFEKIDINYLDYEKITEKYRDEKFIYRL
ncbi:MAG: hypothetical protein N2312_06535 [Dictyoglomaceae bacterium]|nr:hypothetical protein [Dictyoglomaceae bacterium]